MLVDVVGAASVTNTGSVVVVVLVTHASNVTVDTVVATLVVLGLLGILMSIMVGLIIAKLIECVDVVAVSISAGIAIVVSKLTLGLAEASHCVSVVTRVALVGSSSHVIVEMIKTNSTGVGVLLFHGDVVVVDLLFASVARVSEGTISSGAATVATIATIAGASSVLATSTINSSKGISTTELSKIITKSEATEATLIADAEIKSGE